MNALEKNVTEFRHSLGLQIAISAVCGIVIAVFGWMLLAAFLPGLNEPVLRQAAWLVVPLATFILGITGVAMLNTLKGRIIVDHHTVTAITAFSIRTFTFEDVRGYRVPEKKLMFLELHSGERLRISAHFERVGELQRWILERFPDLNATQADREPDAAHHDPLQGISAETRESRIAFAKRVAMAINIAGCFCAAWQLYPKPYLPALLAALSIVPVCVLVVARFRGLIRIDVRKDSNLPTVFAGMFSSSCALALTSFLAFDILSYTRIWLPAAAIVAVLAAVLRWNDAIFPASDGKSLLRMTGTVLVFGTYAYGAIVTSNCYWDRSVPQIHLARIEDRWVSTGSDHLRTHHIRLSAYDGHSVSSQMMIHGSQYRQLAKGDSVFVFEKPGAFGIPWRRILDNWNPDGTSGD